MCKGAELDLFPPYPLKISAVSFKPFCFKVLFSIQDTLLVGLDRQRIIAGKTNQNNVEWNTWRPQGRMAVGYWFFERL